MDLDRNTVRRAVRQPYRTHRTRRAPTVLSSFSELQQQRAPQVHWNALSIGPPGLGKTHLVIVQITGESYRLKEKRQAGLFRTPPLDGGEGSELDDNWG